MSEPKEPKPEKSKPEDEPKMNPDNPAYPIKPSWQQPPTP